MMKIKPKKSLTVVIKGKLLQEIMKRAKLEEYDFELHEFSRILIKRELKGGKK